MVSYKRHLFKTISWRAVGTLDTIILSGIITGSWETGLAIGKGGNYRKTSKGAGMTKKGVRAYRKANPGSKLKTAVTGKVKKGSKSAKRRKSYCARSLGQLKKSSAKTRNDPNSRIRKARRRWKC